MSYPKISHVVTDSGFKKSSIASSILIHIILDKNINNSNILISLTTHTLHKSTEERGPPPLQIAQITM